MDRIKAKLSSFDKTKKGGKKESSEQQEKIKKYIWKPEPGKQVIRIVPSQFTPDFPFTELKFHYDFNGDKRTYLSPSSTGKADPIVELANKLEKSKETWLKGRKMQPKSRTYVPIIVRGKEEEGVKFWGFGVQVYEQLLSAIAEPDYGDLTDMVNGYDIQVDFKTAEEAKKDYPETKILIKPKPRPVIDPENPRAREILELITKKQPDIFDIYIPASYDDLVQALDTKMENERNGVSAGSAPRGAERESSPVSSPRQSVVADDTDDDTVVLPTEAVIAEVTSQVSPTLQKAKKASSVEDFEAAFANIFPAKK